jgi:hypothetical protein
LRRLEPPGQLYTGRGVDDDERVIDPATESARVRAMFVGRLDTARLGTRILGGRGRRPSDGFSDLILPRQAACCDEKPVGTTEMIKIPLPDGVTLDGAVMVRPISPA